MSPDELQIKGSTDLFIVLARKRMLSSKKDLRTGYLTIGYKISMQDSYMDFSESNDSEKKRKERKMKQEKYSWGYQKLGR